MRERRISFKWVITKNCNYRCPYCRQAEEWLNFRPDNPCLSAAKWANLWNNIYNNYGAANISISGGEPFLYPNFIDIINELSKQHVIRINTNLFFDEGLFISKVKSKNIILDVILHPLFTEIEKFLEKAAILKDAGFLGKISCVAYPPQIAQVMHYMHKFETKGLSLVFNPFYGKYQDKPYPENYSENEKNIIGREAVNDKLMEYKIHQKTNPIKICHAGYASAVIESNGMVKRCAFHPRGLVGNFLDENFRLFDTPLPCSFGNCPYPDNISLTDQDENKKVHNLQGLYKNAEVAVILAPGWGRDNPPYVLALLCGILRQKGYSVFTSDINNKLYHLAKEKEKLLWRWEESSFWQKFHSVEKYISENSNNFDSIVDEIINSGAGIACFSVYSTNRLMSLELSKRLKARNPDIKIIFGGTECKRKIDWRSLIMQDCVDFLVFDEADTILPELIEIILQNRDLSGCKGIAYKSDKKIIDCQEAIYPETLDFLPFADFSDFDFNLYADKADCILIPLMTSRGCTEPCVYCSTKQATDKFRTMSGKRIFDEIMYQIKKLGKAKPVFIFFLDLLINAKMEVMQDWVTLLAEEKQKDKNLAGLSWYAQVILRNGMSQEILEKVKLSGCVMLNYGVESGSAAVLKDMGKRSTLEEMEKTIKSIYDAGIPARGNFMIGFPTETEENFQETLDFVKKSGIYMKEIYPSRTFCALENFSILNAHREKFGITVPFEGGDNLFWESQGGKNNYLVRMDRYERFCELLASFPHNPLVTGIADVKRDKYLSMGDYLRLAGKYSEALDSYNKYLSLGGTNKTVWENINLCGRELKNDQKIDIAGLDNITDAPALSIKQNQILNEDEYKERKISLASTPPNLFFQIDGPCNQNCIFCSRPDEYSHFNLAHYQSNLEKKLYPIFKKASLISLTGAGEFLLLPEARKILNYFDAEFPDATKMFATNGSALTPEIAHLLAEGKSKYAVQVSLHSSNAGLHAKLTKSANFAKAVENTKYLCGLRGQSGKLEVNFMFLATLANIENLPDFIHFAAEMKPDCICCEYNSIYRPAQRGLSCFLNQELTNRIFDEAEIIARKKNIPLRLPWRFMQSNYPRTGCREPWSNIMINSKGEVLPCCFFEGVVGNVLDNNFIDIWNNEKYKRLRADVLGQSKAVYCKNCFKNHPEFVNKISGHVISRNISNKELIEFSDAAAPVIINRENFVSKPEGLRTTFVWRLNYACNYGCPYCQVSFWDDKKVLNEDKTIYLSVEQWLKYWDKVYDRYGSVEIHIVGGEPTIYPNFFELVYELSKKHYLGFDTNLSANFDSFIKKIDPARFTFGIGASFHLSHANFQEFIRKVELLAKAQFKIWVNYVAYPLQLRQMAYFKEEVEKRGLHFVMQPFSGKHKGKGYPQSYSAEERDFIKNLAKGNDVLEENMMYQLDRKSVKGKLCYAGMKFAFIHGDGRVTRCGESSGDIVGNFFDANFKLWDGPLPCDSETCYCEFKWLVDKQGVKGKCQ